jgi:hypothetical protein
MTAPDITEKVIASDCLTCGDGIAWIACPRGGWWAHDRHPADEHRAVAVSDPAEWMDDDGWYRTELTDPEPKEVDCE